MFFEFKVSVSGTQGPPVYCRTNPIWQIQSTLCCIICKLGINARAYRKNSGFQLFLQTQVESHFSQKMIRVTQPYSSFLLIIHCKQVGSIPVLIPFVSPIPQTQTISILQIGMKP